MASTQQTPVNIAIIGGGIAGLALAIGLQKYSHVDVCVYESAREFGEVGAGVVLGPNAQRAMHLIDPRILEGYNCRCNFDDTPPDADGLCPWMTVVKGQEPDVGELVTQFKHKLKGGAIHRAHFLAELVKLIDPERTRTYFGKKLEWIKEVQGDGGDGRRPPIQLHFKDCSTAEADVVVGADGVHSTVRKFVLGPDNPASVPFFTGAIQYRATVPMDVARARLGSGTPDQEAAIFMGQNGSAFGLPLNNDTLYYVGVTVVDPDTEWIDGRRWTTAANIEAVKARFADWDERTRNLVGLLPTDGSVMAWSIWEMPLAATYWKGGVVLVGDAAHASTPFQGAGAGSAVEDVLVLEKLVGQYLNLERGGEGLGERESMVPMVLQAYDTARRFRSQKIVTASREQGRIMTCNEPGVGGKAEDLRKALRGRQDWIWDFDLEGHVKDAGLLVEEMLDAGRRRRRKV